jgi:hypothetical protein
VSIFRQYLIDCEANKKILNDIPDNGDIQNGELTIAVMDKGWVFVGFITKLENDKIRLDCCHNIHRWGTTKGLGEIAENGPTKDTVLYSSEPIFGKPIFLLKTSDKWLF